MGVRPEDLELTTDSGGGIPVTVDVVEELGADAYIYGTAKVHQHAEADEDSDAPEKPFIARVDGRSRRRRARPSTSPPSRATCTCSTPSPVSASATDHAARMPGGRLPYAGAGHPPVRPATGGWQSPIAGSHAPPRSGSMSTWPSRSPPPARIRPCSTCPGSCRWRPGPRRSWPPCPRGISRHVVRFVKLSGRVLAVKEIKADIAAREYQMLRMLNRFDLPCVEPFGIVSGRVGTDGTRARRLPHHPAPAVLAALPRAVQPVAAPGHLDPADRRPRGAARARAPGRLLVG